MDRDTLPHSYFTQLGGTGYHKLLVLFTAFLCCLQFLILKTIKLFHSFLYVQFPLQDTFQRLQETYCTSNQTRTEIRIIYAYSGFYDFHLQQLRKKLLNKWLGGQMGLFLAEHELFRDFQPDIYFQVIYMKQMVGLLQNMNVKRDTHTIGWLNHR